MFENTVKTMCNFNRYEERNIKVFNNRIGLAIDPDLSKGIKLQTFRQYMTH